MAKYIDVESDYFYIKGREDEKIGFITFLLKEGSRTFEQIAEIVGTTIGNTFSLLRLKN
jgi:hypothetical protein